MENTFTDRNLVFETILASGTVYLSLDNQLIYWRRFERHISINVLYDKGVPLLTSDKSPVFTFVASEQIHPNLSHNSNLISSNQVQIVSTEYSNQLKSDSQNHYADKILPSSIGNISCGNSSKNVDKTISMKNLAHKELISFDPWTRDINSDVTNSSNVDVSNTDAENTQENMDSVQVDDNDGNFDSAGDDFKKSKRTSERLSNIATKINKNCVENVFKNDKFKKKFSRSKVKIENITTEKDQVKTKRMNKECSVKISLTLMKMRPKRKYDKKTENIFKKSQSYEKCRKLKTTIRDTTERTKGEKVKKLELEREVKCEFCSKTFRSQQEYFDHRKCDRTSFKCKVCSKTVPFKAHLMVHMRKHNNLQEFVPLDEVNSKNAEQFDESKTSDDSGDCKSNKQIKCDVCGLNVSNIPILKSHTMIHTGEYAYKCCICGERTHSIAKHNNHMSTHLKSGKVQCKICNISFESRSDLSRHQLTHEFKCSICDQVFPNKTSRVFHYKIAHKDGILKCNVCGKMFSSEEELAPHMKYHRNRAKTQCTICGLFVTRLDNHVLSHSQKSEDSRMYVCDQCPKQFKQKLSFQRHLRTHSDEKPYACMECSKRFARSGGLRRHMITHTQEKPFVCNICGKACSQMGNLRIHMQIHKDGSPVQCQVCGENFSYKNSLNEHMRAAHYVDMSLTDSSKYVSTVPLEYYV